jgi:hypothetical protein
MAASAYVLSILTCLFCSWLLLRAYRGGRERLLLWSGICFLGLAMDNALLFADVVLFPDVSMMAWRGLPALAGMGAMLYGLIWEVR